MWNSNQREQKFRQQIEQIEQIKQILIF